MASTRLCHSVHVRPHLQEGREEDSSPLAGCCVRDTGNVAERDALVQRRLPELQDQVRGRDFKGG